MNQISFDSSRVYLDTVQQGYQTWLKGWTWPTESGHPVCCASCEMDHLFLQAEFSSWISMP